MGTVVQRCGEEQSLPGTRSEQGRATVLVTLTKRSSCCLLQPNANATHLVITIRRFELIGKPMSSWTTTPSALDASTQAFPVLTAAQISRLRLGSKLRKVEPGEILFQPDDTEVPFFVLLSGGMEIVQPDLAGERPIANPRSRRIHRRDDDDFRAALPGARPGYAGR